MEWHIAGGQLHIAQWPAEIDINGVTVIDINGVTVRKTNHALNK